MFTKKNILEYLHIEHEGVIKMTRLVLSGYVYWPTIDDEQGEPVKHCLQCIEMRLTPRREFSYLGWFPTLPGKEYI